MGHAVAVLRRGQRGARCRGLHFEPSMTKHAEQDDFRSPQPATARTEARIKELRPLVERAEFDDVALGALLADLTDVDVRAVGRAFGERMSALSHQHRYVAATRLCERLGARSGMLEARRAFV